MMRPHKENRPDSRELGGEGNRGDRDNGFSKSQEHPSHSCPNRQYANDAKWFACHPGRMYRFRHAHLGELPSNRKEQWIVVKQLIPGMRIRLAVGIEGTGWNAPTTDEELARLFEAVANKEPICIVGGHCVPVASIQEGGCA